MPVYDKINWEGVRIKAHPLGWRGIPILGPLLEKAPMFSGSRGVFCVHVKATDAKRQATVRISWYYHGPSQAAEPPIHVIEKPLSKNFKFQVSTPRMMASGEGGIALSGLRLFPGDSMKISRDTETPELVGFDIKSSDTLMFLIYGIILTAMVGTVAALGGAWAGSRLFQVDEPIPVVIVEEPPTQPSEPTGGSP